VSKGYGKIERSIIKYFEENKSATTNGVIKYLRTELNLNSHTSSIYKAMKLLRLDEVLIPSKTKNLLKGYVPNSQVPKLYSLDKNSKKYLRYKEQK
jgi:hypothetical protein